MQTTQHEEYSTNAANAWVQYTSEEGWPYYYNESTGQSSWEVPAVNNEIQSYYEEEIPQVPAQEKYHTNSNVNTNNSIPVEHADDMEEMCAFFKSSCSLSHLAARTAASESIARNISTPKKLAKVWNRNDLHLAELQLDDDDSEEVAIALRVILSTPHPITMTSSTLGTQGQYGAGGNGYPGVLDDSSYSRNSGLGGSGYAMQAPLVTQSSSHQNQRHRPQIHRNANSSGAGGEVEDNFEFYETESIITHSTRNSRGSHHMHNHNQTHDNQILSSKQKQLSNDSAAANWIEYKDSDGNIYYYNEVTQMVQWNSPYAHHQAMIRPQSQQQLQSNQHQEYNNSNDLNLDTHTYDYPQEPYIAGYSYSNNRTSLHTQGNSNSNGMSTTHSLGNGNSNSNNSHGYGQNDYDDDDDDHSVSDLSSGSESRQKRSKGYANVDKLKKARKERILSKKLSLNIHGRFAAGAGTGAGTSTSTGSKNKGKLPSQYSKTMERANLYSNDMNNTINNSQTSRNRNKNSRANGGDGDGDDGDSLPTAMNQRSLEVWSRFFENALKAKEDGGNSIQNEFVQQFSLPQLQANEWLVILEDDEFANMIEFITSQSPSLTRDTNLNIALIYAITASEIAVVERLLQLGADPNFIDMIQLRTPLHHAARTGSLPLVAMIFDHGGDAEVVDCNGQVPLHVACLGGYYDIIQYFCESAVNVNSIDNNGNTSFHLLCDYIVDQAPAETDTSYQYDDHKHELMNNAILCYDLLIEYDASSIVKNNNGKNPLDYARKYMTLYISISTAESKSMADSNINAIENVNKNVGAGAGTLHELILRFEALYSQLGVPISYVMELPSPPPQDKQTNKHAHTPDDSLNSNVDDNPSILPPLGLPVSTANNNDINMMMMPPPVPPSKMLSSSGTVSGVDSSSGIANVNPNANPNANANAAFPSPLNSPNRNKPQWASTLKVNLGNGDGYGNGNQTGNEGFMNNGSTGSNSQYDSHGRKKPSPTFPSPTHTPSRCISNVNTAAANGNSNGNDDDWVRDVNERLKDRGSPSSANIMLSTHYQSNSNKWLTTTSGSSDGAIAGSGSGSGSTAINTGTGTSTLLTTNETNPGFDGHGYMNADSHKATNVNAYTNNTDNKKNKSGVGVGEAVVETIWATASSLMGVTLSMFNADAADANTNATSTSESYNKNNNHSKDKADDID
jgi:hypothetical protein